jgi:hypothetical protein
MTAWDVGRYLEGMEKYQCKILFACIFVWTSTPYSTPSIKFNLIIKKGRWVGPEVIEALEPVFLHFMPVILKFAYVEMVFVKCASVTYGAALRDGASQIGASSCHVLNTTTHLARARQK